MDPYDYNCLSAVQAYELRRRGMDVEASAAPAAFLPGGGDAGGQGLEDLERAWGIEFHGLSGGPHELPAAVRRADPGARFFIAAEWIFGGGHVFCAENLGGTVRLVDPQIGSPEVTAYLRVAERIAYARVDTATPGPSVLEFVTASPSRKRRP